MKTYTVQKGDTLSAIAQRELGSASRWPEIHRLNPGIDDPNLIHPGQVLRLPGNGGGLVQSIVNYFRRRP